MLYPVENDFRRLIRLDGIWDFVLDPEDRGVELGVDAAVRDHIGPVWYRRSFFVPTDWRGSAVVVRVGAASHHATLYVNGVEVCRHQGGFLPFEGEATGAVVFGRENELVLRVDNRLDWSTLPPGRLAPAGRKCPGYSGS